MLDLEQQLHDYGTFLDGLEPEPAAVIATTSHGHRSRLVAATVAAVLLVGGTIAVVARRDSNNQVTVRGSGSGDTTPAPASGPAVVAEEPTFAQQVAQLEGWYANAVADAPGGRPILVAEYEVCDYRGAPELGAGVSGGFASYFPLGESLTKAALVEGCLHRDDITKGIPTSSQLCSAARRGPVYDTEAKFVKLVPKPVVLFGTGECAAAGYEPFTPTFLDEINERRRVEIAIRAVPRRCPTATEAAAWVAKITGRELGGPWVVVEPSAGTGTCVRPSQVDWDLWRVALERF